MYLRVLRLLLMMLSSWQTRLEFGVGAEGGLGRPPTFALVHLLDGGRRTMTNACGAHRRRQSMFGARCGILSYAGFSDLGDGI